MEVDIESVVRDHAAVGLDSRVAVTLHGVVLDGAAAEISTLRDTETAAPIAADVETLDEVRVAMDVHTAMTQPLNGAVADCDVEVGNKRRRDPIPAARPGARLQPSAAVSRPEDPSWAMFGLYVVLDVVIATIAVPRSRACRPVIVYVFPLSFSFVIALLNSVVSR